MKRRFKSKNSYRPLNDPSLNIDFSIDSYSGSMGVWPMEWDVFGDCNHQWKEYEGLREKYEYCVKCDKKKGEK